MNLVCNSVFFITAIAIILYDYRVQKIPLLLVLLNYSSVCLLISPYLLVGNVLILYCAKIDKPIDVVYIVLLAICLILYRNTYSFLMIVPLLIQAVYSKKDKISFMISIELALVIFILLR